MESNIRFYDLKSDYEMQSQLPGVKAKRDYPILAAYN